MAHDVFISYSARDKTTADAACATLEAHGIRCWIAPRDVLAGANWAGAIIDAIHESRLLLLVFSADSNGSQQVMRELERAVSTGIPIIPFRIQDVIPSNAMEYYLGSHHWLDALTPPLQTHLERLTETVTALLQRNPAGAGQAAVASGLSRPDLSERPRASAPGLLESLRKYQWPAAAGGAAVLVVALLAVLFAARGHGHQANVPSQSGGPPAVAALAATTAGAGASCAGWTGNFSTYFGRMGPLTRSGDTVSGNYQYKQGKITGSVSGNLMTGTWSEAPSYTAPNDAGDVELTLAADGSFFGRWRHGSSGNWQTNWTGGCLGQTSPGAAGACAAPAAAAPATAAPVARGGSLTIKAYIDGRSDLVLCGSTARWHHFDWAAPGLLGCENGAKAQPTTINGHDTLPTWTAGSGCSRQFCNCDSATITGISPPIPADVSLSSVSLQSIDCRDSCAIAQAGAGQVTLDFNDDPSQGAAWYTVTLCFGSGPCSASPAP
jgi:hypothetical protein